MAFYKFSNKNINTLERIDASEYVRKLLVLNRKTEWWLPLYPKTLNEAEQVRDFLNKPKNTATKSIRDLQSGFPYWDTQKVDFLEVKSKYGRGYRFYFICNRCNRRIKHLYEYSMCETPLCRICCRLKYKTSQKKEKNLYRLLSSKGPFYSSEVRYAIAKIVGITQSDLPPENLNK